MRTKPEVSVFMPVLNEEENIGKVIEEVIEVMEGFGRSYEVMAINNPSTDNTYEVMKKLGDKYEHFYPINMKPRIGNEHLAKGYQYKLGFILAEGDYIVHMDSDYEDDPADIPNMIQKLEEGYDLVVGWRTDRKHSFFYMFTSKIYNFFSNLFTNINIHDKNCGIKAYTKSAAKAVKLHGMNFRGIPIHLAARGYKVTEIPVNNRKRLGGSGKFGFVTRLKAGTLDFISDVFVSKTGDMPFRFWGLWGIIFMILSVFLWSAYIYTAIVGSIKIEYTLVIFGASLITTFLSIIMTIVGIMMEFILHQNPTTLDDFTILDDYKGRVRDYNSNTK